MRKILERLLEKGFKVTFSEEAGVPVICIYKNEELTYTCKLGIGRFKEDVEDTLNSALMELCKFDKASSRDAKNNSRNNKDNYDYYFFGPDYED